MHAMTGTNKPELKLLLAGPPHLQRGTGKKLELNLRDALMLALIAIEGPQPRVRVANLLSYQSSPEAARNTLRQRLFALRKQCGHDLVVGSATLELASDLTHDLTGSPTVLGELQLPECPEFDRWLQTERQRRLGQQREALAIQIDALEAAGKLGSALNLAQSLLQLDQLSEDAHRRLIRLHYLRGDRSAALLAFDRCAEILKDEVGVTPSEPTMQLLDSIQRAVAPQALAPRRQVPPSVLRPPRMIGREALRQRILNDITAGLVVVVVGEAGMGKSRMLAEIGAELGTDHGHFVGAAARPGDAGVPFASLARLLRELIRHCPAALESVPRHELARLMPELGTATPSGAESQRLVFEQAVSALIDASRSDIDALGFDDLHFADEASLDMLTSITASATRTGMRWVLALRPAEEDSRTAALMDVLAETGTLAQAELAPLSVPELQALVDSLGVPGLSGAQLGSQLHQQSGGNPLFALETVKRLLIDEVMTGHANQGGGFALQTLPRPASVLALIERRLSHLSISALAVARVAAVADVDFSIDLAQHVLAQQALLLSDAWSELERAQVLRESAFAHDLVFEAVLQGIPTPIARHTHGLVAQYLAQHQGEAARVASHYLAAAQVTDALPWLKQAATAAGKALRSKEQMDFWLKAADIEERAGLKDEAFESLTAALEVDLQGGSNSDLALGERLQALAFTEKQEAQAYSIRMEQLTQHQQFIKAAELGPKAMASAQAANDDELYYHSRQFLGIVLCLCGKSEEALDAMLPIEPWIDAHASLKLKGDFHGNLGIVLGNLGRLEESMRHHLLGCEAVRALSLWSQVSASLGNLSINRLDVGDINAALNHLREGEQLSSLYSSDHMARASSATCLSICTRIKGQFVEALQWADLVAQRGSSSSVLVAYADIRRVEIWTELGQFARALHQLEALAKRPDLPFAASVSILCLRAHTHRYQGVTFASSLEQALRALPEGARPDLLHRILLARALLEPPLQALALTERVVEDALAKGMQGTVMAAYARRAGCLWRHDPALALDAARRALELAELFDSSALYRPELWLNAARAMRAAGLEAEARQQLALARAWIMNCVTSGQVPEPFVDSFLHRNPINRDILSEA
jgi:DNA-binding SARP family transcriptional activator